MNTIDAEIFSRAQSSKLATIRGAEWASGIKTNKWVVQNQRVIRKAFILYRIGNDEQIVT
ncbi:MAG: hypothetical protein ABL858_06995 [Candidatus Nitrotoga sp.]